MATPAPGAPMPNGFAAHSSAVRSPGMQHPLQQQYANAMRHPNGAVGLTAQHVAAMRLRAIQQQQMIQQQQQQQQQQMPGMITQADMLARVQQMHPGLTHEQAQLQAQKQVAHYHDQLRNNMAAQVQVRRNSVNVRAGTGGTGVLIGANGPIGPGAAAMAAAQQQQQQQAQQSRSATPVGMAASPRMGQLQQGQQQQQPQPQPAQQQVQSPCPPQPLQQAVGLGVQMSPQPSPAPPQPQPQSQQQ
ncbi:hypothetical protein FN846DRAFT_942712 [Sphaerosporella brunnea]|uniref:Uncharacterized protein n=1 Tax=Sphaerosporella brunnea TaxID=1250544 RepID=A0A5J5F0V4_9PEZI|nr:hypothetical protein FN846DRAFT_942712 [Sphaerosporella brunnea]